MASRDGGGGPGTDDRSLGEIVSEVSEKASLLVREEIELAKAEVQAKVSKLGKGIAAGLVAAVFAILALIYLLHGLAYLLADLIDGDTWAGYLMVTGGLILLGIVCGLLALRFVKRGAPPTPDLAIEEAKKTREMLEDARA